MLSPQKFVPPFQSHFYPSTIPNKNEETTQNLFANKEAQINNLMKVNIIFKKNIQLFYEFYCIQLYLTNQMITILKQLCIENIIHDTPSDDELVQGFNEIFVAPIYEQLLSHMYRKPQLPNDQQIKLKLQIHKYPMSMKRKIENIAYQMGLLLVFACNELQLDNDEKVLDYIDEYKSVRHHELKLNLLGYKRWLNELTLKYCYTSDVIIGYIHRYGAIRNDEINLQIKQLILMSFYCPFGSNKSNAEIKELVYGPFLDSCGHRISLLFQSIVHSIMGVHVFLSAHSTKKQLKFDENDLIIEEIWD